MDQWVTGDHATTIIRLLARICCWLELSCRWCAHAAGVKKIPREEDAAAGVQDITRRYLFLGSIFVSWFVLCQFGTQKVEKHGEMMHSAA